MVTGKDKVCGEIRCGVCSMMSLNMDSLIIQVWIWIWEGMILAKKTTSWVYGLR